MGLTEVIEWLISLGYTPEALSNDEIYNLANAILTVTPTAQMNLRSWTSPMDDELEMLSALGLNKFLDPSNLVDDVIDRRNNPVPGISAPWSKLQDQFEIPRQGVTLIGGYSGHQKSTLANQWALHAANTGHKVCIASLELTTDYLFDFLAGQSACKTEMHEGYLRRFGSWLTRSCTS